MNRAPPSTESGQEPKRCADKRFLKLTDSLTQNREWDAAHMPGIYRAAKPWGRPAAPIDSPRPDLVSLCRAYRAIQGRESALRVRALIVHYRSRSYRTPGTIVGRSIVQHYLAPA